MERKLTRPSVRHKRMTEHVVEQVKNNFAFLFIIARTALPESEKLAA